MSEITHEFLGDDEPTFDDDLRWARQQPSYWAEKLKLDVADAVTTALERQGMSRAELARRMQTSPAFVTRILRGYHNWSLDTLAKAGVALGLQWLVVPAPIDAVARTYTRLEFADARAISAAAQRTLSSPTAEWTKAATLLPEELEDHGNVPAAA